MVDFKFDALQVSLHREPPEVGLVENLTGSLYWWVEQYVPTLHRECIALSDLYMERGEISSESMGGKKILKLNIIIIITNIS